MSWRRRTGQLAFGLVALAAATFLGPAEARAEGPASPDGKGIAGGILLGGEVVMLTEAIAGVDEAWPYPVFGVVGAAGGGVGGYFVEQTGSAEAAMYMLAGGMALFIPTLVAVLNATAYEPGEDDEEQEEPGAAPGAAPGGDLSVDVETGSRRNLPPPALLGVDRSGVALGIPAPGLVPRYSVAETVQLGVAQASELRFPVVQGSF